MAKFIAIPVIIVFSIEIRYTIYEYSSIADYNVVKRMEAYRMAKTVAIGIQQHSLEKLSYRLCVSSFRETSTIKTQ